MPSALAANFTNNFVSIRHAGLSRNDQPSSVPALILVRCDRMENALQQIYMIFAISATLLVEYAGKDIPVTVKFFFKRV